jgi:uncharacterized protein (DUF2252 family)
MHFGRERKWQAGVTIAVAAVMACACSGPRRGGQQPSPPAAHAATQAAARSNPFDILVEAYGPYMNQNDPLAFPMKVRAVAADKSGLWRGGKDLFFRWCRDHARDWMDDRDAIVTQQGDPHLGNVGTYLAAGDFGTLAFGMVDFDESVRLSFQYELLQGIVSLRLVAEESGMGLDGPAVDRLVRQTLEDYTAAAASGKTATDLLRDDPDVAKLLGGARRDYATELSQYTSGGKFLPVRATRKEVKDLMRPAMDRADELAAGIAEAVGRSEASAALFRLRTAAEFRAAVRDAVLRTRVGSAGSQGLKKYFVLLERPLAGVDHDVIVYVKQQIPSAPERAGLVPPDPRDPGRRCAEDVAELTDPKPFFNGWCRIGDESYWVSLREPWTDELEGADVHSAADLAAAAHVWATAAGTSHHGAGVAEVVTARNTPELAGELVRLSGAYLRQLDGEFQQLAADPRVAKLVGVANAAIEERHEAAPPPPKKQRKSRHPV